VRKDSNRAALIGKGRSDVSRKIGAKNFLTRTDDEEAEEDKDEEEDKGEEEDKDEERKTR